MNPTSTLNYKLQGIPAYIIIYLDHLLFNFIIGNEPRVDSFKPVNSVGNRYSKTGTLHSLPQLD